AFFNAMHFPNVVGLSIQFKLFPLSTKTLQYPQYQDSIGALFRNVGEQFPQVKSLYLDISWTTCTSRDAGQMSHQGTYVHVSIPFFRFHNLERLVVECDTHLYLIKD